MSISLGDKPDSLVVYLSRFGDFYAGLQHFDSEDAEDPSDWPDGIQIDLRFYPDKEADEEVTWTATITDDLATWWIPRATVNSQVLSLGNDTARLIYTDTSGRELEWYTGTVRNTK